MQYPYFTTLELVSTVAFLLLGVYIFSLLAQKWQSVGKMKASRAMSLYLLGSVLVYVVYPYPLLSRLLGFRLAGVLDFLAYVLVLFLVFYLTMRKLLAMDLKRTFGLFFVTILIIFPILGSLRMVSADFMSNFGVISSEREQMEKDFDNYAEKHGIAQMQNFEYSWVLGRIGDLQIATLTWPAARLRRVMVMR